jgi:hypothetical protein
MRIDVQKPLDETEDYQALAGITGTDAELDAMVDGITDLQAVREHLRRLTRAVRTLVRQ